MKKKFFILSLSSLLTLTALSFSNSYEYNISKTPFLKISNSSAKISSEKAKEIALRHSGISKSNAKFTKIKLDVEDGILVYEIEFYSNNREYEYDINANTGEIVSFEID